MLQKLTNYCTKQNADKLAKENIEITTVAFVTLVIVLVNVLIPG